MVDVLLDLLVFLEVVVLEWDKHLDQCLNRNKEIL
jgi:hypothetical protein